MLLCHPGNEELRLVIFPSDSYLEKYANGFLLQLPCKMPCFSGSSCESLISTPRLHPIIYCCHQLGQYSNSTSCKAHPRLANTLWA